jgi:choline dehydrogenase-like flavoprotein
VFLDSSKVPDGKIFEFDVCICGGGAAGLTVALDLVGSGLRTCVLESGSFRREHSTQSLYEGRNISRIYEDDGDSFRDYLRSTRSRFLGGSSNCWGGWCRPFDEIDFAKRKWVPHSGWSISKTELLPFYVRAHNVLKLGPFEYDPMYWQEAICSPRFQTLPFNKGLVTTEISQFSPPVRFGRDYRKEIAKATDVVTILHANVVDLETNAVNNQVQRVHVRNLSGVRFSVQSRYVVLAAGGIENARLLLASNQRHKTGLGNEHDLVGRFFMEHAAVPSGRLVFTKPVSGTDVYDAAHFYRNQRLSVNGVPVAAHFGISEAEQERHGILNSRTFIQPIYAYPDDGTPAVESLRNLYNLASRFYKHRQFRFSDGINIVAHPGVITTAILARLTKASRYVAGYRIVHIVEPGPNPDSRVTLDTERDRLGMPKVVLDWRPTDLQRRTITVAQRLIGAELNRLGIGYVEEWEPPATSWPKDMYWVWHHIGTTRMHQDPSKGVVNETCRVHSVPNLYISGSSVFPTAGKDMPTLTIVAMALRLADHLKRDAVR